MKDKLVAFSGLVPNKDRGRVRAVKYPGTCTTCIHVECKTLRQGRNDHNITEYNIKYVVPFAC